MTADARLDIRGESLSDLDSLRGTVSVNAPRIVAAGYTRQTSRRTRALMDAGSIDGSAAAYGAAATAAGRVTLPRGNEPLAFDLRGQARHVDLRRLPRS